MSGLEQAVLYWNTVKRLKPVQLKYQIKNRICSRKKKQKKLLKYVSRLDVPQTAADLKILIPDLDCDENYLSRFCMERILNDEITLLHEPHRLVEIEMPLIQKSRRFLNHERPLVHESHKIWNAARASHLWNYNLHYLEFLIPLAAAYADTAQEKYFLKWKQLAERWMEQSCCIFNDSLEPYTISIRIPNLLICMELLEERIRNTEIQSKMLASIYRQYRYLLCTQERALLANHYLENLKTILISSLLFEEMDIYHKYFDLFLKQADEQILPDGMHYERSLMYHKIILEDFLRVYYALYTSGHPCDAEKLLPAVRSMASALADLEQGFGHRTPLFNDAGNNAGKKSRQLQKAVNSLPGPAACRAEKRKQQLKVPGLQRREETGVRIFKDSGYYKLLADGIAVLFDCGDIGPSYMGGHAHCDCLSFELAVSTRCMFVNSGTGCYQGEHRTFFRSTRAHNTVMTDDREQAQLWGEHRAGRRMTHIEGTVGRNMLAGRFRNFLGDLFQRTVKWEHSRRTLVITDRIRAGDKKMHTARQFFHLAPEYSYRTEGNRIHIMEGKCCRAVMRIPAESRYQIHRNGEITLYAEDFGRYEKKQVLEIRTRFEGSIRLQTEIEMDPGIWEGKKNQAEMKQENRRSK